jgi:hypothetical protein
MQQQEQRNELMNLMTGEGSVQHKGQNFTISSSSIISKNSQGTQLCIVADGS